MEVSTAAALAAAQLNVDEADDNADAIVEASAGTAQGNDVEKLNLVGWQTAEVNFTGAVVGAPGMDIQFTDVGAHFVVAGESDGNFADAASALGEADSSIAEVVAEVPADVHSDVVAAEDN